MKYIIKIALLSVLIMSPNWAVAGNSNPTHTHTNTPIELGFVSANYAPEFKLAGVCFLGQGDCGGGSFGKGDEDMSIPLPPTPEEQCLDEGFVATCKAGEVADTICPYQPNYKKCKCNPCDGYGYTLSETTVQGYVEDGSCQSCEVVKYKRKENPCSGYTTCECGGEIGAKVCYTGSIKKFSNCKSCIPPRGSCAIGWIYYADGTCVTPAAHTTSKVALGVVVYVNPDGIGGQVVTARDLGRMSWSTEYVDISGLPNYQTQASAATDFNSCTNTDKIVAYGDSSKYPAAWAARNYTPTAETKGKWCLPAAGIMTSIYNNQGAVQAGIAKLGGVAFPSCCTWSSSEYVNYRSWNAVLGHSYGLTTYSKILSYHVVRSVLEF